MLFAMTPTMISASTSAFRITLSAMVPDCPAGTLQPVLAQATAYTCRGAKRDRRTSQSPGASTATRLVNGRSRTRVEDLGRADGSAFQDRTRRHQARRA